MVRVSTTGRSATRKPDSESSTTTAPALTTGTKPIGDVKQVVCNKRTDVFDVYIRREALGLLRKHKRMSVHEIYDILNVRYTGITREDVNAVLIVMGFEGLVIIDYEPVAIIKG